VNPFPWLAACAALALPAAARPTLPELPLGTGAASFAGGGAGHSAGIGSLFDNPAALSVRDEFQIEAGLMGLAAGLSPYVLYGSHAAGNSSFALGYFYDARPGDPELPSAPRQGMIAGASWDVLPWAVAGASVRSTGTGLGVGSDGFGVDEDVGALIRAWSACWLGLAVRNVMESGVGQVPDGFRTHRSYAASLGTGLSGMRMAGIVFHEPDAYYELRSIGLPLGGRMAHAFSLGSAFMPGGRLGFRGTFLVPHGGIPGFALGSFLNLPLGRGALVVGYTFHSGGPEETGEVQASHSISMNFRLGGRMDPLPPVVAVAADKVLLAAEDTLAPQVHFRLSARDMTYVPGRSDTEEEGAGEPHWAGRKVSLDEGRTLTEGRIRDWCLSICSIGEGGLAGPEVKSYHGRDLPPRVIRWEAVDTEGRHLPPGFYAFRLQATDLAGNQAATVWQLLQIGTPPAITGN
jgi:hypothetical protein